MALCTATFEAGTNGNTIAAADPGSATAWDSVVLNTGALIYDNTQAAHGVLAGKVTTTGTATVTYAQWDTALGTVTDHYGRIYLYFTANPATTRVPVSFYNAATLAAYLFIDTAGKVGIDTNGHGTITTTAAISLNQWIRVEWHIVHNTSTGTLEAKLFNTASSSTPTETKTSGALNTDSQATLCRVGQSVAAAANVLVQFDDIVAGATSYPGPVEGVAVVTSGGGGSGSGLQRRHVGAGGAVDRNVPELWIPRQMPPRPQGTPPPLWGKN